MKHFASRATTATGTSPRVGLRWLRDLLLSEHLGVRVLSLFTLSAAVFVICQTIAYLWLPEGLLRGASLGSVVVGEEAASSFLAEWAVIVGWNLPMLLLFYVAANLVRLANGVPLGYVSVIVMQAYFGVITGTNSFTMAAETGKIAPSVSWLVHPGFYELLAYALAAAATYEITRWQDAKIDGKTKAVRFQPVRGGWRSPQLWRGLILAVGVLLTAGAWEAHNIVAL
jgi:Stage II sporulation protein M